MLNVKAIWGAVGVKARELASASANAKEDSVDSRSASAAANHKALEFGALLWTQGIRDSASYKVLTSYSDYKLLPKSEKQRISERMSRVKAVWKTPEGSQEFAHNAARWVKEGITEDERTELYKLIRAEMTADRLMGMYTRMKYLDEAESKKFLNDFAKMENLTKKLEKVA